MFDSVPIIFHRRIFELSGSVLTDWTVQSRLSITFSNCSVISFCTLILQCVNFTCCSSGSEAWLTWGFGSSDGVVRMGVETDSSMTSSADDDSDSDVCNVCMRLGGCVGLSSCDTRCCRLVDDCSLLLVSLGGGAGLCICAVLVLVDGSDGVVSVCCSVGDWECLARHLSA